MSLSLQVTRRRLLNRGPRIRGLQDGVRLGRRPAGQQPQANQQDDGSQAPHGGQLPHHDYGSSPTTSGLGSRRRLPPLHRRRFAVRGHGWGCGPAAPGQGDDAGHQPEDAHDQADDRQSAGGGGVAPGLIALGGQGGIDAGGLAVGPGGQLAPGGLLDRVLDFGRVLDVGERLRAGGEGLVDLLALDGAGEWKR
jgi:hypothetical protein